MANLVPGTLMKLIQHMNTDVKVAGEHRSVSLQVVSIVPALAAGELFPNQGFYLKVSDSSHATFVSLPDEHDDLILSDKIQLGQYILVERFEAASPVPILQGVKLIPGRHPCAGCPEDIVSTHLVRFLNKNSSSGYMSTGKVKSALTRLHSRSTGEKEKPVPARLSNVSKEEQPIRKTLLSRSKSHFAKRELDAVAADKGNNIFGKSKSYNSIKSLPSSPNSIYSLPTSFDKISSSIKHPAKVKGSDVGTKTSQLSGKTSAPYGTGSSPLIKRVSTGNAIKSWVQGIQSGSKNLRKGWEHNIETKPKESSKMRAGKTSLSSVTSSRTTLKKDLTPSRSLSANYGSKIQVAAKSSKGEKMIDPQPAKRTPGDSPENSVKQRTSIGRKSPGEGSYNGLGSLAKVSLNNLRLTEASSSWASLPSSLSKLGKEVLKYRDTAQMASIEAMQEASVAESLLRYLSTYSELSSSAKEDDPQLAIEKFMVFHSSLTNTRAVADSLSRAIQAGSFPGSEGNNSLEDLNAVSEIRKQTSSWIHAALATNISPFSIYKKDLSSASKTTSASIKSLSSVSESQPIIVLESNNRSPMTRSTTLAKSQPSVTSKIATLSLTRRLSNALASAHKPLAPSLHPAALPLEWNRGNGLDEAIDLADMMLVECQTWFIIFMENFLDSNVDSSLLSDSSQIAGMLTQLKNVNSWLEKMSTPEGNVEIPSYLSSNTIDRLRKKIYEYLLTHVESAAAALDKTSQPQSSRTIIEAADTKIRR